MDEGGAKQANSSQAGHQSTACIIIIIVRWQDKSFHR